MRPGEKPLVLYGDLKGKTAQQLNKEMVSHFLTEAQQDTGMLQELNRNMSGVMDMLLTESELLAPWREQLMNEPIVLFFFLALHGARSNRAEENWLSKLRNWWAFRNMEKHSHKLLAIIAPGLDPHVFETELASYLPMLKSSGRRHVYVHVEPKKED